MQAWGKHEGQVYPDRWNASGFGDGPGDADQLISSIYSLIRNHSPEEAETFAATFPRVLEELKDEIFGPAIVEGVAIGTVIKKRKEEAADD